MAPALLFCGSVSALYMGNPAEPQIIDQGFWISQDASFGAKVGYQGDSVFDRKMRPCSQTHGRIDRMTLSRNQGVVAFNYIDRVEIYGSVGSMTGRLSNRPHFDHKRRRYHTYNGWTAGTGGRFLLAQWNKTVIGIDGKIQWSNPGMKKMSVDGFSKGAVGHLRYCEWQVSFAISYSADWFVPYFGVKYSNVHATVSGIPQTIYPHSQFKISNRDRFGCALGCTVSPGKRFDLFAEAQLIDERGVSFGGNLRF